MKAGFLLAVRWIESGVFVTPELNKQSELMQNTLSAHQKPSNAIKNIM